MFEKKPKRKLSCFVDGIKLGLNRWSGKTFFKIPSAWIIVILRKFLGMRCTSELSCLSMHHGSSLGMQAVWRLHSGTTTGAPALLSQVTSAEVVRDGWGWDLVSTLFCQMYMFPNILEEILVLLKPVTKIPGNLWITDAHFSLQDYQWWIKLVFGLPLGLIWKSKSEYSSMEHHSVIFLQTVFNSVCLFI